MPNFFWNVYEMFMNICKSNVPELYFENDLYNFLAGVSKLIEVRNIFKFCLASSMFDYLTHHFIFNALHVAILIFRFI